MTGISNMSRLRSGVAPLIIGLMAFTPAANAQETEAPSAMPQQLDEPAATTSESTETSIVVTGSRLRRSEFNSPDPITIINPELSKAQGLFSTAEMLQSSSIASGSNQVTSAISTVSGVTNGGPGSETISLRGLGAERTLVLLNGRRAGPAGTRGGVSSFDLNVLPQSIVQSVEIVKTGASSVYGSDAIAGVVNLITKKDTDGIEFSANSSVPQESGGEQYRLGLAYGKDFGNGHIMVAFDYFHRSELKRRDRDYLDCPEEYIFRTDGSRADLIDPRTGSPRCSGAAWGHNWVYTSSFAQAGRWQFDYPGDNLGSVIGQNNPPGFITPPGFYRVGYDRASASVDNLYHPFMSAQTVSPKTDRYTAYVDAAFNITDNIEIGTELLFNRRKTEAKGWAQFYYLTGYTSDFDGTGFGDPFVPGWEGPYYVSPTPITDHAGGRQKVDYYRGLGYAKGTFGGFLNEWDWNIWGQYSRSNGKYVSDVVYQDAIDAFNYRTSSCAGTNTPISNRPCVDINWLDPRFLRGDLNEAERNMLYGEDFGKTTYTQAIIEASVAGKVVDLPAGAAQIALGATWRRDAINDTPGINQQINNNFVGSAAGITAGRTITKEVFGEIEIPLIHNTPLIENFTLSASARTTAVDMLQAGTGRSDSTNGNWTYSVGANWKVNSWLAFRAKYGTSFRAPALFELFLADQSFGIRNRGVDPCVNYVANEASGQIPTFVADNCRAGTATIPGIPEVIGVDANGNPLAYAGGGIQPTAVQGGGIGLLDPETSSARSASVILTPRFDFLPNTRINIAVDYFDIRIKGEIAALSPAQVVGGCYASVNFPEEPLCNLFERYAVGTSSQYNLRLVRASFININSQRNEGIDFTTSIEQDLGKLGKISFLAQMTWQLKDKTAVFGGFVEDDNGEAGDPKWTGDFRVVYEPSDKFSFFYGVNVIGRTNNDQDYIDLVANGSLCQTGSVVYGDYCVELTGEKKFYHNTSVTISLDKFEITAGVSNLFDTKPPRTTIVGSNALNAGTVLTLGQSVFTSQYDLLGRRFFLNATAKF